MSTHHLISEWLLPDARVTC